ncbi:hypothetical protein P3T23_009573 [Paraburkholderia sp. GAS448]|jgi:hypothetical protein
MQREQTDFQTSGEMKWMIELRRVAADAPRSRQWSGRRLVVVALALIPLALLFAWGFLNLMLVLVFPGPSATH